jgi:DNA-binding MarR family transcriptional regulator
MSDPLDDWEVGADGRLRLRSGVGLGGDDLTAGPEDDPPLHPSARRVDDTTRRRPVFRSLHAAYHRLARRLDRLLAEAGADLSATDAVVLVAVSAEPGGAITLSRRDTGLHPSTITSVLDRLERRGLVRRERGADDHRFVAVWPTLPGRIASDQARSALATLDEELRVHVLPDDLAAIEEVSDAAGVIAPRGTPPDY